MYYMHMRYED